MSADNLPTNTLTCIEKEIARVADETHQQLIFLSNLRAKRNSLLPVFRLPPETLAIIFTRGARDYHESHSAGHSTRYIPSWVNVSYVCSHWCNTALNCSTLWTYHFNLSLRWTEELLLRSKQASLKISCIYPSPPEEPCWRLNLVDKLLQHSERIQELCLHLPSHFIPATLSLCAHRLENLEIQFFRQPEWSLAISDGDTPVLRKLKLIRCSLPWHSFNLRRLNTLYLRRVPVQSNMAEFLALLRDMQDLSILQLEYALPSARGLLSSGRLGTSPKINLPCLALLTVAAPLSTVVALLSCVNTPSRTRLNLTPLHERGSSARDYAPISSFLTQQFSASEQPSPSGLVFHSLIIHVSRLPEVTFNSSEHDHVPPSRVGELVHKIPLKITFGEEDEEMEMAEGDKHCIISDICCSLPLKNLQSLNVLFPCQFSADLWRGVLRDLDGLRYMKLSYGGMPDLSDLFLAAHESRESPGVQPTLDQHPTSRHIFIPALEELELQQITFTHDNVQRQGVMSKRSLFNALSTRKALRDRVRMISCLVG